MAVEEVADRSRDGGETLDVEEARGNEQRAVLEHEAARAIFERIGSVPVAIEPRAERSHAARSSSNLDAFRHEGDYWAVTFEGHTVRVRDRKGMRYLARLLALGGRDRRSGSASERARASVTTAVRQAIARMGEHHPSLAAHLEHAIRTGTYCAYSPDPTAPVEWQWG